MFIPLLFFSNPRDDRPPVGGNIYNIIISVVEEEVGEEGRGLEQQYDGDQKQNKSDHQLLSDHQISHMTRAEIYHNV